jgi:hypothetical protein
VRFDTGLGAGLGLERAGCALLLDDNHAPI